MRRDAILGFVLFCALVTSPAHAQTINPRSFIHAR